MSKIAILTYHDIPEPVVDGVPKPMPGWNTHGENRLFLFHCPPDVEPAWIRWSAMLRALIPEIDRVVVYIGRIGGRGKGFLALGLAADVPREKLIVLACGCADRGTLREALPGVPIVDCECGGHRELRDLYAQFFLTGKALVLVRSAS